MNDLIIKIFQNYKDGIISIQEAMHQLEQSQNEDLGFAKPDLLRKSRCGTSEVIYAASKTPSQILEIAQSLISHNQSPVLITRLSQDAAEYISSQLELNYDDVSHTGTIGKIDPPDGIGKIAVVTAGTSDIAVAEEAVKTLEFLRNDVERIYDVGVAGIHRLFAKLDNLRAAQVIIAIAGMEGALASVIAGITEVPVIAVPTSIGYGAAFEGLAALLSMINSCAAGVSVVNIDNGFGAAYIASKINHPKIVR